jgi:hypothetical protein
VDLVEIDCVDSEPLNTAVSGSEESAVAQVEWRNFRGYNYLLAVASDGFTDNLLRPSISIDLGGVDEIDANFQGFLESVQ